MILDGGTYDDAAAHARSCCDERGLVFVHAVQRLDVMAGQGTLALEMLEDCPDLEILPVPIGGGGLISGMATAAKALKPEMAVSAWRRRCIPRSPPACAA